MDMTKYYDVWELMSEFKFEVDPNLVKDEMLCLICMRLLMDACYSVCGCQYCFKCISNHLDEGAKHCPGSKEQCKEEYLSLERDVMRNMRMNNKINNLKVLCPNECSQSSIKLTEMRDHLRLCTMQEMECPYVSIGCDNKEKLKKVILTHLHINKSIHTQLLIDGINNMKNDINALKEKLEIVKLEIFSLIDESRIKEAENCKLLDQIMEQTRQISEQLSQQMTDVSKHQSEFVEQMNRQRCELIDKQLEEKKEFEIRMAKQKEEILEQILEQKREFSQLIAEQGQKMKDEMLCENDKICQQVLEHKDALEYLKIESKNKENSLIDIKNELTETMNDIRSTVTTMAGKTMELEVHNQAIEIIRNDGRMEVDNVHIQLSELKEVLKMKSENFDDEISQKINNLIKLCPSVDVDFVWRINDCSKKMYSMRGKRIFSEAFYSNHYKLCLYMYINNTGNNVGLYCLIMKGEKDDEVEWPMKRSVSLSIVDQDTLRTHKSVTYQFDSYKYNRSVFERPTGDMNSHGICACPILDYGYVKDRPSLMVNDCIVVSCVIRD